MLAVSRMYRRNMAVRPAQYEVDTWKEMFIQGDGWSYRQ